jgi:phage-related protein
MDGFFNWLGEAIGNVIRAVINGLHGIFGNLWEAIDGFVDGLTGSLGISDSLFSIAVLVIGVLLLINGIRSLIRGGIVGGIVWLLLGLLILSWLIR